MECRPRVHACNIIEKDLLSNGTVSREPSGVIPS
jgi:hypothetical protein